MAAIVAGIIGIQAWFSLRTFERQVEADLQGTAERTARAIANDLEILGTLKDVERISVMLRDVLATTPSLRDISVLDTTPGTPRRVASSSSETSGETLGAGRLALERGIPVWTGLDQSVRTFALSTLQDGRPFGVVTVTMSFTALEELRSRGRQVTLWFAIGAILVVTVLVDRMTKWLVHGRLEHIRQTIRRAASGELKARASVDRLDEIGVVAQGLNDMLEGLERLNDALQARVQAATAELRQRNLEIVDTHRRMTMLSDELARAGRLAALGQAATVVAHQIGTPLNLISGYAQLLIESSPPGTPSLDRLKAIQDQVAKVTAVVRTVLESARRPSAPRERADLGDLAKRVCEMAGPMLERAGVEVEVVAPEQPAELLADPLQLELVLLNLISNSVDAMAPGGKLTIRLTRAADRLRLEVADTGSGIPAELLGHIFEPGVTTKTPGKGTGLGLSIARQVVLRHGGTIAVDSRAGEGAVFTIDLPAAEGVPQQRDVVHAQDSDC